MLRGCVLLQEHCCGGKARQFVTDRKKFAAKKRRAPERFSARMKSQNEFSLVEEVQRGGPYPPSILQFPAAFSWDVLLLAPDPSDPPFA
jgi:hypothetical protein